MPPHKFQVNLKTAVVNDCVDENEAETKNDKIIIPVVSIFPFKARYEATAITAIRAR